MHSQKKQGNTKDGYKALKKTEPRKIKLRSAFWYKNAHQYENDSFGTESDSGEEANDKTYNPKKVQSASKSSLSDSAEDITEVNPVASKSKKPKKKKAKVSTRDGIKVQTLTDLPRL
jgi:hypothetical protein